MQADHGDVMHALRELTGFTSRVEIMEMELQKLQKTRGGVVVPEKFIQDAAKLKTADLEERVAKLERLLDRTWDMIGKLTGDGEERHAA